MRSWAAAAAHIGHTIPQRGGEGGAGGGKTFLRRDGVGSTLAAAAASSAGGSAQRQGAVSGGVVHNRDRLGSTNSQKREREELEEAFQQYQTRNQARKQRKVAYGCSQVNIEEEGAAAPVEYYVGNTTNRATKEIIGSVLAKCAQGLESGSNFSVVEVQQLATHLENPRTLCWKVVVSINSLWKEMNCIHQGGLTGSSLGPGMPKGTQQSMLERMTRW